MGLISESIIRYAARLAYIQVIDILSCCCMLAGDLFVAGKNGLLAKDYIKITTFLRGLIKLNNSMTFSRRSLHTNWQL